MDLVAQAEAREEEARAWFVAHDADDSGTIDAAELASVFRALGLKRADQDEASFETLVGRRLREHDANADGVLSFDEFQRLYNAVKGVAAHPPGASRLTTGVTLAFLRDLPGVVAKLEGGRTEFPEVGAHILKTPHSYHARVFLRFGIRRAWMGGALAFFSSCVKENDFFELLKHGIWI